jgi:hypothetical protein
VELPPHFVESIDAPVWQSLCFERATIEAVLARKEPRTLLRRWGPICRVVIDLNLDVAETPATGQVL